MTELAPAGRAIAGEASLVISVEDIHGKYRGEETVTGPDGQTRVKPVMNIDEVVNRVTVLAYLGKDSYTAESGEKHVIARRARGNRDIEVTANRPARTEPGNSSWLSS